MTLTVGSLFSGIGGIDLGLERAGMRVVWQCEADEYARRVLRKHWPDVPCLRDVRYVRRGRVERVDVIAGGFPCQDISQAGKGRGLAGKNSGLWWEYARVVDELRPRWALVENVAALRTRGLSRILEWLAARGYDAEWDCLPAAALGAPHLRDRLFLVAYSRRNLVRQQSERHQQQPPQRAPADADGRHTDVADADGERLEGRVFTRRAGEWLAGARSAAIAGHWGAEPDVGRVAHGVSNRVDRLRCLGNAVAPAVAEYLGRLILAAQEAA